MKVRVFFHKKSSSVSGLGEFVNRVWWVPYPYLDFPIPAHSHSTHLYPLWSLRLEYTGFSMSVQCTDILLSYLFNTEGGLTRPSCAKCVCVCEIRKYVHVTSYRCTYIWHAIMHTIWTPRLGLVVSLGLPHVVTLCDSCAPHRHFH